MTLLPGVLITCALLAAWGISLTWLALRHDIPGFGFLDRLPDPAVLLRSLMPRIGAKNSGARDDTRSRSRSAGTRSAAQDGAAGDCSARNALPRAAGGASTRGAQPPGRRSRIVPRGRHHADSLRVDLATTGTLPRLQVDGAPPWTTAPQPAAAEEAAS